MKSESDDTEFTISTRLQVKIRRLRRRLTQTDTSDQSVSLGDIDTSVVVVIRLKTIMLFLSHRQLRVRAPLPRPVRRAPFLAPRRPSRTRCLDSAIDLVRRLVHCDRSACLCHLRTPRRAPGEGEGCTVQCHLVRRLDAPQRLRQCNGCGTITVTITVTRGR